MDRRKFLERAAVGGAAGVVGLAAYGQLTTRSPDDDSDAGRTTPTESTPTVAEPTPPPEAPPVRHQSEFGTVVDVARAGVDATGTEPIGDFLERHAADDTLLSFAPGTYLFPQVKLTGYDHLGIAAAYDEHPTFVAPAGSCTNTDPHAQFGDVTNFLLEGIDFDFRREGAGGAVNVIASGDATVRDVTAAGSCREQITMFRMDVRDPEGVGLVENFRATYDQNNGWMTGAYVGLRHSGAVTFRNCELNGFTDNGIYGSAPGAEDGGDGQVHTEDCTLENNNVSNIRLGTPGSTATGDTVIVESPPDAESINLRGIRFRRGADQVVEDCDIRFGPEATASFGALVFHADNGSARVANTRVTMDSDAVPAVRAFYPSGDGNGDGDTAPTFENLAVDGGANRGFAVTIQGRDGTTFRNCTIEQSGDQRDGIRLAYAENCELVDSRIDVTGFPLILRDATLSIRNTTFVTPHGQRHVDRMEAGPGDFRPETWTTPREE